MRIRKPCQGPVEERSSLCQLIYRWPKWRYKCGTSSALIPPCFRDRHPQLEAEFGAITRLVFPTYERFDQEALEHHNTYRRQQTFLIVFGLLATAAGGLQAIDDDLKRPLGILEALLGVLLFVLASRLRNAGEQRRYVQARLAAERLRGEGFLYLTRVGRYKSDGDRETLLESRVATLAEDQPPAADAAAAAADAPPPAAGADRDAQVWAVYLACRLKDQRDYYGKRRREYEGAARGAGSVAIVLSLFTTLAGVLSAIFGDDGGWVLPVISTVLPALGTAVAGYGALFGFERLSKLYGDAERALAELEVSGRTDPDAVGQAEEIMRREQGQWGQFADEAPIGGSP
jgi:uncharacterized membrane protein YfcA